MVTINLGYTFFHCTNRCRLVLKYPYRALKQKRERKQYKFFPEIRYTLQANAIADYINCY